MYCKNIVSLMYSKKSFHVCAAKTISHYEVQLSRGNTAFRTTMRCENIRELMFWGDPLWVMIILRAPKTWDYQT